MAKSQHRKVLMVITKSNWGGAQKYVHDIATGLDRAHFNVAVALGGDGELKKELLGSGVPVKDIGGLDRDVSVWKDIGVFFKLLGIYRQERPDVIHLNSSKIGGIGAVAGRIYNTISRRPAIIIFTAHGWAFNEERGAISKLLITLSYWVTMLLSSRVIAVSQAMKDQVKGFPLVQKKIVVVHNGVSPATYKEKDPARRALLQDTGILNDQKYIIGTIAELHKIKGLSYAIRAMEIVFKDKPEARKNTVYAIIGEGEERENLEKLIKEKGLGENVFLVGRKKDAATLLKAFDIFILPSLSEGLAYVLLEAGSARLPVIAARTGGIPEIIEDGKTGVLVPVKDPDAVSKAIKAFMDDPGLAGTLAKDLNEKVLKQFSKERMMERTVSLYGN